MSKVSPKKYEKRKIIKNVFKAELQVWLTCKCRRFRCWWFQALCKEAIHSSAEPLCSLSLTRQNRTTWHVRSPSGRLKCCRASHLDDIFLCRREEEDVKKISQQNYYFQFLYFKCMYSRAAAICLATRFEWSSPMPLSETFDVKSPIGRMRSRRRRWEMMKVMKIRGTDLWIIGLNSYPTVRILV